MQGNEASCPSVSHDKHWLGRPGVTLPVLCEREKKTEKTHESRQDKEGWHLAQLQ